MQKNVVLGFSMGGLVARYALRDMEVNNIVHDTRLNISFDSPHQGANVPVGFQAAVLHLAGSGIGVGVPGLTYNPASLTFGRLSPDLGRAGQLLNSPAARQMLRYQVAGSGNFIFFDNAQHTSFMNEYRQLGYPVQSGIRNVVIANGSECGADQGFAAGATFVNVNEGYKLPWWGTLLSNFFSPLALLTNYPQAAIGAPITTRTDIKYEFKVNALRNQTSSEIYKFKLSIKKKILFLINVNLVLIDKSYSSNSSFLPLDNSAGGIYDIGQLGGLPVTVAINRFSFVPTYSALDVGGGNQPIVYSDLTRAYSPASPPIAPKNLLAASFTTNPTEGGRTNEIHTQITLRNGQWLFNEIQATPIPFSCAYVCNSLAGYISSPPIICSNNIAVSFVGQPAGTTINWTFSNGLTYVSGQGTSTVFVRATSTGVATISAVLSGVCGAGAPITKSVNISTGSGTTFLYTFSECYEQIFETDYAAGANVYNWSINDYNNGTTYTYPNHSYKLKTALPGGSYRVNVGSACGGSIRSEDFYVDCGYYRYSISPNPSSELLSIQEVNQAELSIENSVKSESSVQLNIVDQSGNKVLSTIKSQAQNLELDIAGLKPGHYILVISQGKFSETHHLIVN
jgi:hypothetical protein